MFGLCKYKDIFGQPGKGVHQYRIFDIAIVDVLVVVLFGWIISYVTHYRLAYVLAGVFLLGIVAHRLFCVRTKVDRLLFPDK